MPPRRQKHLTPLAKGLLVGGLVTGTYLVGSMLFQSSGFSGGSFTITIAVIDKNTRLPIRSAIVTVTQGVVSQPATTDVNGDANFAGLSSGAINISVNASGYTSTSSVANVAYGGQIITIGMSVGASCQCPSCGCGMICDSTSCPNCFAVPIGNIIPNSPLNITMSWQWNKWCVSQGLMAATLPNPNGNPYTSLNDCSHNCCNGNCGVSNAVCRANTSKQWVFTLNGGQLVDTNGNPICNMPINLAVGGTQVLTLFNGSTITFNVASNSATTDLFGKFPIVITATITDPTTDQNCCVNLGGCFSQGPQYQQARVLATVAGTSKTYPIEVTLTHLIVGNCNLFG